MGGESPGWLSNISTLPHIHEHLSQVSPVKKALGKKSWLWQDEEIVNLQQRRNSVKTLWTPSACLRATCLNGSSWAEHWRWPGWHTRCWWPENTQFTRERADGRVPGPFTSAGVWSVLWSPVQPAQRWNTDFIKSWHKQTCLAKKIWSSLESWTMDPAGSSPGCHLKRKIKPWTGLQQNRPITPAGSRCNV